MRSLNVPPIISRDVQRRPAEDDDGDGDGDDDDVVVGQKSIVRGETCNHQRIIVIKIDYLLNCHHVYIQTIIGLLAQNYTTHSLLGIVLVMILGRISLLSAGRGR